VAAAVTVATRGMGHGTQWATASPLPTVSATAPPEGRPVLPKGFGSDVATVRLTGRSGGRVNVRLSPSARVIRAEVTVDRESLSFAAAVRDAKGAALWRADGLVAPAAGAP